MHDMYLASLPLTNAAAGGFWLRPRAQEGGWLVRGVVLFSCKESPPQSCSFFSFSILVLSYIQWKILGVKSIFKINYVKLIHILRVSFWKTHWVTVALLTDSSVRGFLPSDALWKRHWVSFVEHWHAVLWRFGQRNYPPNQSREKTVNYTQWKPGFFS